MKDDKCFLLLLAIVESGRGSALSEDFFREEYRKWHSLLLTCLGV